MENKIFSYLKKINDSSNIKEEAIKIGLLSTINVYILAAFNFGKH
jgi:hypothetical protein